jgi:hypothetical protein
VDDLRERVGRELARLEPSPGGLEKTLRRVRRRESNRRVGAGAIGLLVMAGLVTGLWLSFGPRQRQPVGPPSPTSGGVGSESRLFLAGDGELWVVDVATTSVRHMRLSELSPGDPPYRIVRRGDKLVLWGYKTYVFDPNADSAPQVLVEDSLVFMPSAAADKVWVAVDSTDTGDVGAIREVAIDGRVTVPDTKPPGGQWPVAALEAGLVFQVPDGQLDVLEVWDPRTGEVIRQLPGQFPVASYGNILAWCADPCDTLHITNVVTGEGVEVRPPPGTYGFEAYQGAFSPDAKAIAIPVRTDPKPTSRKLELALVDVEAGNATRVEGTTVEGYVFVDWSPSGASVFISGGERFTERIIIEYQLSTDSASRLPIEVGDFYGMAVA